MGLKSNTKDVGGWQLGPESGGVCGDREQRIV